jgi:hypothetical protein
MVIRIDIHPTEEKLDRHVVRVAPRVSCITTVHEVSTKSKSGPCSRGEVLAPTNARLSCHPEVSHSPSNKPFRSREARFDEVVTGLLVLSGPLNLTCSQYKSRLTIRAKTMRSLIDTGRGYHLGTLE